MDRRGSAPSGPARRPRWAALAVAVPACAAVAAWQPGDRAPIAATAADFHAPGTQPDPTIDPFYEGIGCASCHGSYDANTAPFRSWIASMMAQSARDPIWQASVTIANQDVESAGQACIRCHAPTAWLGDRHGDGTMVDASASSRPATARPAASRIGR